MDLYEVIFEVTETCQNGNERRIKKSVYSPRFKDHKHVTEAERISKGTEVLKARHYYDIKYINTKAVTLLFTEEV